MNLFNTTSLPQNIKKCEHITSPEYDKHAERKARWSSDDFYGRCGAENKFRSRTGCIDCKYRSIRKR